MKKQNTMHKQYSWLHSFANTFTYLLTYLHAISRNFQAYA